MILHEQDRDAIADLLLGSDGNGYYGTGYSIEVRVG